MIEFAVALNPQRARQMTSSTSHTATNLMIIEHSLFGNERRNCKLETVTQMNIVLLMGFNVLQTSLLHPLVNGWVHKIALGVLVPLQICGIRSGRLTSRTLAIANVDGIYCGANDRG